MPAGQRQRYVVCGDEGCLFHFQFAQGSTKIREEQKIDIAQNEVERVVPMAGSCTARLWETVVMSRGKGLGNDR